jgi:hypothetical protein
VMAGHEGEVMMMAVTSGGRETEGRRRGVRRHFKALYRTAGAERRETIGRGRWAAGGGSCGWGRLAAGGGRKPLTGGPHLSVSERERAEERERRRWIGPGEH